MTNTRIGNFPLLLKGVLFSLIVTFSGASAGQENVEANELATPQFEQVNINNANAETIAKVLDGIGMSRASAIVSFREEFGEFTSLEDIQMVTGVGEITLQNNEAKISFE
ncbi:MAG: helix-hairpin-helix domain-containing protein [Gammaproteobacteria bacterium]|nr:helix-hairpin-helix domain-containing protein [Gammaproteobacteria bacterium]